MKLKNQQTEKTLEMKELMAKTPARLGIGHAGPRYKTDAMLRFEYAHARATEAVRTEVTEETIQKLGVPMFQTCCNSKYDMITRPDLGRLFSEKTLWDISAACQHHIDVEVYFGDGLSSPCIGANVPELYPRLRINLEASGLTVGTPFFVRYCRVNTARQIGPLLDAKITCVLIGERPGLLTGESMSAYFAYRANPNMSESDYRVVANISHAGLDPAEAADLIAHKIREILKINDAPRKPTMLAG